mgnify:FL=1
MARKIATPKLSPAAMKLLRDARAKTADLSCDTIQAQSSWIDWAVVFRSEAEDGEPGAEVILPSYLADPDGYNEAQEEAAEVLGEGETPDVDAARYPADKMREEQGEEDAYAPVMSFFWPLEDRKSYDASDADKLLGLPVTLVKLAGSYGTPNGDLFVLALTGGGMDLSWEIAEAYIRLGCLPPFDLRLPSMAGKELTAQSALTLEACRRSASVLATWTANRRGELARTALDLRLPVRAAKKGKG